MHVQVNCLGMLLKHRVQFSGSGIGPKFCISSKLPGKADGAGLRTHSEWQGHREGNVIRMKGLHQMISFTYCLINLLGWLILGKYAIRKFESVYTLFCADNLGILLIRQE